MNIKHLTLYVLLTASPALLAQDADDNPPGAEELRQQISDARVELAEAARRMARLQRQLAGDQGGTRAWRFRTDEDLPGLAAMELDIAELQNFKGLRALGLSGLTPRLGVLLEHAEAGEPTRVIGLTPGSGAEAAGIERGDLIVSIEGTEVSDGGSEAIRQALSGVEPGATVSVIVERDGEQRAFDIETSSMMKDVRMLVERVAPDATNFEREIVITTLDGNGLVAPPAPPAAPLPPRFSGLGRNSDLVSNHAGLEPYFGTADGVVVLRIDADNAFGLEDGDVVLSLDGETVKRPVDLGRLLLLRNAGDEVVLEVMRRNVLVQLEATIPERAERRLRVGAMGLPAAPRAPEVPSAPPAPVPPEPAPVIL